LKSKIRIGPPPPKKNGTDSGYLGKKIKIDTYTKSRYFEEKIKIGKKKILIDSGYLKKPRLKELAGSRGCLKKSDSKNQAGSGYLKKLGSKNL
jgi:hypothetical protein